MDMPVRNLVPLILALLVGCGGSPPPPSAAKPIDDGPAEEALPPIAAPKPEKSEPEAAAVVNAILLAHTRSEPSLIEKLRKIRIRRKGDWRLPDGTRSEATMDIAIWGDQYRTTYSIAHTGNIPQTIAINRNKGWQFHQQFGPKEVPLDAATLEQVLPEVYGDRMTVLVPLTNPKLIAAMARPVVEGSETIVRIWIEDEPPMLLHVDPKTNRLQRLTYRMNENNQVVARALRLHDYAPVSGVMLPGRVEYGVGSLTFTTWSKIEYEVPGQFELAFFDKP